MKNVKSILFAAAFLISTVAFANPDESTPISGTYTGTMETKSFLGSSDATQARSSKDFGIELLFNGNVFIYQGLNTKAMGTYAIDGNKISFEVTSTKGDAKMANALFNKDYTFSRSDSQLMLIGDNSDGGDVNIIHLSLK